MGNPLPAPYLAGTGTGKKFYPWARGRVRNFTRCPCRGGHGYVLPAPNPPHCHPYDRYISRLLFLLFLKKNIQLLSFKNKRTRISVIREHFLPVVFLAFQVQPHPGDRQFRNNHLHFVQ
jgi:hypothetical protein